MAHDPQHAPTPGARNAHTWRRYLRFWGPRAAADVDDELRFHIEMRIRDAMSRGMSEADARAATIRRLGDLGSTRAACVAITSRRERRMTRAQLLDAFAQDVRFALRTLGRQRGWTAVAILTLALGIGANTAMFSVVNSLLLHPIGYPDADRIAILFQEPTRGNGTGMSVMVMPNAAVLRTWRDDARSVEVQAYGTMDRTLERAGEPAGLVPTAMILPSFPRFAGARMLVGRAFTDEDVATRANVALLSEGFWRSRFAADRAAIGSTVRLDGDIYTVVGVLPGSVALPRLQEGAPEIWTPLDLSRNDVFNLRSVARLREGASIAAASAELDSLVARLPSEAGTHKQFRSKLVAPSKLVNFRESLLMLTGAVALVLLIACANVAHLLLARAAARQRELAIRAALGAGRARLVRQLLTESAVLAVAGCTGGIAIGWAGMRALVALRPEHLAELSAARMDGTALGAAVLLSVVTGALFGLVGVFQAGRHSTHEALKAGALSTSHARTHHRLRALLVMSEMALSTTLLVGATLLVRSVMHLQHTDPGFAPKGLYSLQVALPDKAYATEGAKAGFYATLAARARTIPSVAGATVAAGAPPSRSFLIAALQFEGEPLPPNGETSFIDYNAVAADYFTLMGIPVLQGSTFTDTTERGHQVIVNEATARKHWPTGDALGKKLRTVFNGQGDWLTIVGVVANARTGGLTSELDAPLLYLAGQNRLYSPALIVRAAAGADPIPALRNIVTQIDRHVPAPTVQSVESAMRATLAGPRFTMLLLGAFTSLALVLAAVGLYGVLAYAVAQRTREIGIRVALGATRANIARAVVRQGVLLALGGIVIGLVGAFWATKLLEKMLYGIPRSDPLSFAAGAVVLVATAVLACVVPMRRAVAVDPLIAMRAE